MTPPAEFTTHPLAGNLNHPANLPAIGHALAKALHTSPDQLADLTRANTIDCFTLR
jgi:Tat protein secretion system quality control protein TatD with DNase activity